MILFLLLFERTSAFTIGYAGVLIGPAMLGFAAELTSLTIAFWLLTLLVAIVPVTAYWVVKK